MRLLIVLTTSLLLYGLQAADHHDHPLPECTPLNLEPMQPLLRHPDLAAAEALAQLPLGVAEIDGVPCRIVGEAAQPTGIVVGDQGGGRIAVDGSPAAVFVLHGWSIGPALRAYMNDKYGDKKQAGAWKNGPEERRFSARVMEYVWQYTDDSEAALPILYGYQIDSILADEDRFVYDAPRHWQADGADVQLRWFKVNNPYPERQVRGMRVQAMAPSRGIDTYGEDLGTGFVVAATAVADQSWSIAGENFVYRDWEGTFGERPPRYDAENEQLILPFHGNWHQDYLFARSEPIQGDFTISTRLRHLERAGGYINVGLMVKDALLPSWGMGGDMDMYLLFKARTPPGHPVPSYRTFATGDEAITGEVMMSTGHTPDKRNPGKQVDARLALPLWLRMQRQGETLIGAYSSDGQNWQEITRLSAADLNLEHLPEMLYPGIKTSSSHLLDVAHATVDALTISTP